MLTTHLHHPTKAIKVIVQFDELVVYTTTQVRSDKAIEKVTSETFDSARRCFEKIVAGKLSEGFVYDMAESTVLYFQDGVSNKYYRGSLDGTMVFFTWGRIGTAGQSQSINYQSTFQARQAYLDKLAEKRAKGYRESFATPSNTKAVESLIPLPDLGWKKFAKDIGPSPAKKPAPPKPVEVKKPGRRLFSLDD